MRKLGIYIILTILVTSCHKELIHSPQIIGKQDTLFVPGFEIQFRTEAYNWSALLYTATQPIQLESTHKDDILTVTMKKESGITEGQGEILLTSQHASFSYRVYVKNKSKTDLDQKDFRSPKTLNPDFNLKQQRLLYQYDAYRNLVAMNEDTYFQEEEIIHRPKSGIYRAQEESVITSFYVQPGTCSHIPLKAVYNAQTKNYEVVAGPLYDEYKNQIMNGTQVVFSYKTANKLWRREAQVMDGYARMQIANSQKEITQLVAIVNTTVSQPLNLISK